jgi:hypothetical protein
MRFVWFNLMPWPDLPDDFREKYRSVWVEIPSVLYDPVRGHEVYNTYLDQLDLAAAIAELKTSYTGPLIVGADLQCTPIAQ